MRSRQPWCRYSLTNRFLAKNCGVRKKKPLQRKRLKLPHRKHGKSRGRSAEGTPEGGIARCEAAAPPGEKEYRQGVRQERGQEIRLLWHIVEFIMLVTFIVLAIDQVGLYGFLFVWFFIALAAASIVLLLAGLIRAFRKKRAGIMILVSLIGIIGCIAWFIFWFRQN